MSQTTERAKRGPGRPKRFDPDTVIDNAVEIFWTRGYRDTTTRDLERGLGLSQSSIYNAFGSKRELFEAVLDRFLDSIRTEVIAPALTAGSGIGALKAMFSRIADRVEKDGRGCMVATMMIEDAGKTRSLTLRADEFRKEMREAMRDRLEFASRFEGLPRDSVSARSEVLVSLMFGLCTVARSGVDSEEYAKMLSGIHALLDSWRVVA